MNITSFDVHRSAERQRDLILLKRASLKELLLDIQEKLQIEITDEQEARFLTHSENSINNSFQSSTVSAYKKNNTLCFYKDPVSISGYDVDSLSHCNNYAHSINGWESHYKKTYSSYCQKRKEINMACMSGQYLDVLYPNENKLIFGVTYNETFGTFRDIITIPPGITNVGSSLFLKARLKISDQPEEAVFRLVPGESGSRLHDLVGVQGNIFMEISYNNNQSWVSTSKLFLSKFQADKYHEFGDYDGTIDVSSTIPLNGNWLIKYPFINISIVLNISTFTGQNFVPGITNDSHKQFALIDLREFNKQSPLIIPDPAKKGAGGVTIQWYKLCFSEAIESNF